MNYNAILERGTRYACNALVTWGNRRNLLIRSCSKAKNCKTLSRLHNLIHILERRCLYLSKIYNIKKDAFEKEKMEVDHSPIFLECSNLKCKMNPENLGHAIRYKDYQPGKLKCNTCGAELEPKDLPGTLQLLNEIFTK